MGDAGKEAEEEARRARAAVRKDWPIRVYKLGEEPPEDLSATTTAAERLAMMWPLALQAWAFTGKPLPTYTRAETPIRIVPSPVRKKGSTESKPNSEPGRPASDE